MGALIEAGASTAGAYMRGPTCGGPRVGALIEAGASTVDTPASITAAGATKPAKQTKKRPAK